MATVVENPFMIHDKSIREDVLKCISEDPVSILQFTSESHSLILVIGINHSRYIRMNLHFYKNAVEKSMKNY